ncbi:hypothetical protein [Kitasatospora cineracea]|uniref:Uncharacterized protein n=1 Tax=Kitasatospora cineracea TaxID=88074 RepID=A0A8G1XG28_9ACTN|nr:hypothetical protein [Kitasatospora cineracea]ROR44767.1 hypothetical protein EDD39_2976 [Kitasatospora cineracea]
MADKDTGESRMVQAEGEAITPSESALVIKMTETGEITGLSTARDGREAGVDVTPDGRVIARTAGAWPLKAEREQRTGQSLTNHLNRQGASWGPAELTEGGKQEDGVDCIAVDTEDDTVKLLIQTTVVDRTDTWKQLAQSQTAAHPEMTIEQIVEAIKTAIESKQTRPKKGIHLALDATDSINATLPPATNAFRAAYGSWTAGLGYEGVYLVGPETLVSRLDAPD